jgi:multidrug transporter EmrE-like cation transporter
MNAVSFALILTGVLLNAAAQLLLKAGTNAVGHFEFQMENAIPVGLKLAFQPFIMGGMTCYAISLVVWIMALSRVPVSVAYPMLSIGYVVNAAVANYWFGEALTAQKMLGIGLIVLGVYVVGRS